MSQQINLGKIALKAAKDLKDKMYYLGKINAEGNLDIAGQNDVVIGVIDGKPRAGESCAVIILGTSKVVAGGAITVGSKIISNAEGKAIPIPTTEGSYNVVGIALESASNENEIIEVLLRPETVIIG